MWTLVIEKRWKLCVCVVCSREFSSWQPALTDILFFVFLSWRCVLLLVCVCVCVCVYMFHASPSPRGHRCCQPLVKNSVHQAEVGEVSLRAPRRQVLSIYPRFNQLLPLRLILLLREQGPTNAAATTAKAGDVKSLNSNCEETIQARTESKKLWSDSKAKWASNRLYNNNKNQSWQYFPKIVKYF